VCVRERERCQRKREREFHGPSDITGGDVWAAAKSAERERMRARAHACSGPGAGISRERIGGRGWKQTRIVQLFGTKNL